MNKKILFFLAFQTLIFSLFSEKMPLCSARNCIKNMCENSKSGYVITSDFIYYQIKEDDLDFAYKNIQNSKIIHAKNDFSPGFKLGFGYYIPRLSWNIYLNWMQLYSNSKTNLNNETIIPLFSNKDLFSVNNINSIFSSAKAKLLFYFNSLDLEVSDSFFVNKNISIRIHGGLKGAVIHQKFNIFYNDGNSINSLKLTFPLINLTSSPNSL